MEKSSSSIKFSCEFIIQSLLRTNGFKFKNYLQIGQVKTINSNKNKSIGRSVVFRPAH